MKKYGLYIIIMFSALFFAHSVHADYVLPYPSYMPGNKIYRISRIIDKLKHNWYWGTIAQIKYHLGLSDKYLVEAKTLFEYKQYLLGADALRRSDAELASITTLIGKGNTEGKDMSQLETLIADAMQVHVDVLAAMEEQLPEEFLWTPEKKNATNLPIGNMLDTALSIRKKILNEMRGRTGRFTENS